MYLSVTCWQIVWRSSRAGEEWLFFFDLLQQTTCSYSPDYACHQPLISWHLPQILTIHCDKYYIKYSSNLTKIFSSKCSVNDNSQINIRIAALPILTVKPKRNNIIAVPRFIPAVLNQNLIQLMQVFL